MRITAATPRQHADVFAVQVALFQRVVEFACAAAASFKTKRRPSSWGRSAFGIAHLGNWPSRLSIEAVVLGYDMPGMIGDEVAQVLKR